MEADEGDYIVRGVEGETYPVKPDIFSETYQQIGPDMDIALDRCHRLELVKTLLARVSDNELVSPDDDLDESTLENVLSKISPNWQEADSVEDIEIRSITVHRSTTPSVKD